jgi:hypothetical protein
MCVADGVTTEVNSVEEVDNRLIYSRYLNRFELDYKSLLLLRVERTICSFHPHKMRCEPAYKPGSVENNHSSRPAIARRLKQPTRFQRGTRHTKPYLVLLRVEFTLQPTVTRGPVRSYHTLSPLPSVCTSGGLLSAALVVGLRRPGVTWHPTLWSPDFPPVGNFHTNRRLLGQLTRAF